MPMMIRRLALLLPALALAFLPAPARAQERPQGLRLQAAIGGAVPYAGKESYVVATLGGGSKNGKIAFASTLPFSAMARPVFDARPLYAFGAGLGLGHLGGALLWVDGQVAAGALPSPDQPLPLLGLARLRLVF